MNNKYFILHALFFKIFWVLAIISAYKNIIWGLLILTTIYIAIHLFYNSFSVVNFAKVVFFAIIGMAVDAMNLYFEVFKMNNLDYYLLPTWLILLWIGFSIFALDIVNHLLKNIYLLSVVCGFFAPLSYLMGESINILVYSDYGLLIIFLQWLVFFPLIMHKIAY